MKYKFVIMDNQKQLSKYFVDSSITSGKEEDISKDTACILANLFFQMCQKGMDAADQGLFTLIYNSIEPYSLLKGINLINTFFKDRFTIIQASIIKEEFIFDETPEGVFEKVTEVKTIPQVNNKDTMDLKKVPCGNNGEFILILCSERVFIAHRKASDKDMTSPNRICIEDCVAISFFTDLNEIGNKYSIYKDTSPKLFSKWKNRVNEMYERQKATYIRSLK